MDGDSSSKWDTVSFNPPEFTGDEYLNAFFDQLKERGISYELTRKMENDVAHFPVI